MKSKIKRNLLPIFLCFLLALSSSFMEQEKQIFTSVENNFSISYPVNWTQKSLPGKILMVSEPATKSYLTIQTALDIEKYSINNLDSASKYYEKRLLDSPQYKDAKMVGKDSVSFSGMKACQYVYSHSYSGFNFEWKSVIFILNGNAYAVSVTCEKGDLEKQKEGVDSIFNSFTLLK